MLQLKNGRTISLVIKGVGIAIAFSLIMSAVVALLILNEVLKQNAISWITPIINGVSVMVGCLAGITRDTEKKGVIYGVTAAIYLFLMIIAGMITSGRLRVNWWHGIFGGSAGWLVACLISAIKIKRKFKYS